MDMGKIILKFILKGNETRITIMILEKKKINMKNKAIWFQDYYSYSNQDCVVLAEGQTDT